MHSDATILIPFDNCVIVVCLFNRAEFPGRPAEVAQSFDPISAVQLLTGGRGLGKPRLSGPI